MMVVMIFDEEETLFLYNADDHHAVFFHAKWEHQMIAVIVCTLW
jgi:hypothetical protein